MRRQSNLALLSASAALLASCIVGCSTTSTETPDGGMSPDAATDGPATDATTETGADTGAADVKASDGSLHDGAIADGGGLDATTDAMTDAMTDSTTDATADGTTTDAPTDASDGGPPEPLALCTLFDSRFLLNEADASTGGAESARSSSWAFDIYNNFFNRTGAYVAGNCSLSGFTLAVANSSDNGAAYNDYLDSWIQQFLGCPVVEEAGALSYGLLPSELAGHVYTTADLNQLSSDFIDGINNTLACAGDCIANVQNDGGEPPSLAPLTTEQIDSIQAELAHLQSQVSTSLVDSGSLSFTPDPSCDPSSSCFALCPNPDAGP
jgi:hypothetical protein